MAKQVSCFFLILLLSSIAQIQARDSFFFSKLTHYSINKHHEKKPKKLIPPVVAPTLAPTQTPAPAPTPTTILQSGLDETELLNQEQNQGNNYYYNSNNYNNEYRLTGETSLTGYEDENYNNNNGYKLKKNGYESSNYNSNGYSTSYKSSNNGYYEMERQGMSDTRSLENGRYYYVVKNYYPTGYEGTRNNAQSYYGNSNQSSNEEEYQNQEAYQEIPEEYVP